MKSVMGSVCSRSSGPKGMKRVSKSATAPEAVPKSAVPIPEPPSWISLSYIPDVGPGYDAAAEWCVGVCKIPVTGVTIKKAVINRKLPRTILTGKMWFSTADLWAYLMGERGYPGGDPAVAR